MEEKNGTPGGEVRAGVEGSKDAATSAPVVAARRGRSATKKPEAVCDTDTGIVALTLLKRCWQV